MPLVSKNHSADVSQTYTRPKNTSPPTTGITHPRRPLRVSRTIFVTNAPEKKHPNSEWNSTRLSYDSKPSAYRQCTATGTLISTASRPDHTCAVPIQDGALPPGISRYIAKADAS